MTEDKLIGEVSAEQIQAWKAKHGGLNAVVIDGHIGYLRPLDRTVVSAAMSTINYTINTDRESGKVQATVDMGRLQRTGEIVLVNCWLGGSEAIRNDMTLYPGACIKAGDLVTIKEAEIKKF